jgi:hypothetical protein
MGQRASFLLLLALCACKDPKSAPVVDQGREATSDPRNGQGDEAGRAEAPEPPVSPAPTPTPTPTPAPRESTRTIVLADGSTLVVDRQAALLTPPFVELHLVAAAPTIYLNQLPNGPTIGDRCQEQHDLVFKTKARLQTATDPNLIRVLRKSLEIALEDMASPAGAFTFETSPESFAAAHQALQSHAEPYHRVELVPGRLAAKDESRSLVRVDHEENQRGFASLDEYLSQVTVSDRVSIRPSIAQFCDLVLLSATNTIGFRSESGSTIRVRLKF